MFDLGVGADPAVDGDHQAGAGGGELVKRFGGDAVALAETVGQPPEDLGAHLGAQELGQQEGGGDAVGVVVAVDGDGLAAAEGAVDALAGRGHAVEQVRAVDAKVGVRVGAAAGSVSPRRARISAARRPMWSSSASVAAARRSTGPICQVCSLIATSVYRRRQTEAAARSGRGAKAGGGGLGTDAHVGRGAGFGQPRRQQRGAAFERELGDDRRTGRGERLRVGGATAEDLHHVPAADRGDRDHEDADARRRKRPCQR